MVRELYMAVSTFLWGFFTLATYYSSILVLLNIDEKLHFRTLASFGGSIICLFFSMVFCLFVLDPPKWKPSAKLRKMVAIITAGGLLSVITSLVVLIVET